MTTLSHIMEETNFSIRLYFRGSMVLVNGDPRRVQVRNDIKEKGG